MERARSIARSKSAKELKRDLREWEVDHSHCLEKNELVELYTAEVRRLSQIEEEMLPTEEDIQNQNQGSSDCMTRAEHLEEIEKLRLMYKKEAMRACDRRFKEGLEKGRAEGRESGGELAQLRAQVHAAGKLRKRYKKEALRACEESRKKGRAEAAQEIDRLTAEIKLLRRQQQQQLPARVDASRERLQTRGLNLRNFHGMKRI